MSLAVIGRAVLPDRVAVEPHPHGERLVVDDVDRLGVVVSTRQPPSVVIRTALPVVGASTCAVLAP